MDMVQMKCDDADNERATNTEAEKVNSILCCWSLEKCFISTLYFFYIFVCSVNSLWRAAACPANT